MSDHDEKGGGQGGERRVRIAIAGLGNCASSLLQGIEHYRSVPLETQEAWGLWKFADTSDSFYHFSLALSSSVTGWMEIQLSLVNDYKNKPASPELEKNDLALLANLVFKL